MKKTLNEASGQSVPNLKECFMEELIRLLHQWYFYEWKSDLKKKLTYNLQE